jgi:hypothetical protein
MMLGVIELQPSMHGYLPSLCMILVEITERFTN